MENYNSYVAELFKIEIGTTVYAVKEGLITYKLTLDNSKFTLPFLSLDDYYDRAVSYIHVLLELQRKAISEVRVMEVSSKQGILYDAREHLEKLNEALERAMEHEIACTGDTVLDMDYSFMENRILSHMIITKQAKTDPIQRISSLFATRLRELIQWRRDSLSDFIEKIQKKIVVTDSSQPIEKLSARQRALIIALSGEVVRRSDRDSNLYNHFVSLCRATDRIGFANESPRKAKALLKDYKIVLPYLKQTSRERAEDEILAIESKIM